MTTTGTTYDHAAHTELFEYLQALEPDDTWIDAGRELFWAATPSSPLGILALTEHSGLPILSLQESQPVGIDLTRDDFATEALNLLGDLRADIEEEIFADSEHQFGSGVPLKEYVNLRSVRIRLVSAIQDKRRTFTGEAQYAVPGQRRKTTVAE